MKKRPWLAALLNFIIPGVGYLYLGCRKVFSYFLILGTILGVIEGIRLNSPAPESPYSYLIAVTFLLGFAYDAYNEAKKLNRNS